MEKLNFFENAISSEDELRELVGTPHELIVNKTISFIDELCEKFIAASPLLFLATADRQGRCDVSPRGDQPGSVLVLNSTQLVIADRPGNKRLDSILNILSNPYVGLTFLIPGSDEVLRINGRASIIKNQELLTKMNWKGKSPVLGIGIDVEECYIHCPRALKEAKIWAPDTWPQKNAVPTMMEIFKEHLKINGLELDT